MHISKKTSQLLEVSKCLCRTVACRLKKHRRFTNSSNKWHYVLLCSWRLVCGGNVIPEYKPISSTIKDMPKKWLINRPIVTIDTYIRRTTLVGTWAGAPESLFFDGFLLLADMLLFCEQCSSAVINRCLPSIIHLLSPLLVDEFLQQSKTHKSVNDFRSP